MGNLRSVQKAFERVGATAIITTDPEVIETASAAVLPGVGAFGDAMANLHATGLTSAIHRIIDKGRPFLGICLGQQLLFESSEEMGQYAGLGVFKGRVVRFPNTEFKVPHVGWNEIHIQKASPILNGVADGSFAYFVHSFLTIPDDPTTILAKTDYGFDFASVIGHGHVFGIQFHPEKSQVIGLRILQNFAALASE
jgi:imidazole glycerol-phosphate synthase subunit HisH